MTRSKRRRAIVDINKINRQFWDEHGEILALAEAMDAAKQLTHAQCVDLLERGAEAIRRAVDQTTKRRGESAWRASVKRRPAAEARRAQGDQIRARVIAGAKRMLERDPSTTRDAAAAAIAPRVGKSDEHTVQILKRSRLFAARRRRRR